MFHKKKNRFRPIFKQFLRLKENIKNSKKLLKFKKIKWKRFQKSYLNKISRFRKFKPLDHFIYFVTKYSSRNFSYKKKFREILHIVKRFKIFYGYLAHKYFKKIIKKIINTFKLGSFKKPEALFIKFFESRLDTILYKAKFALTIRSAQKLIANGKVFVNNFKINNQSYQLKKGDLISICDKYLSILENNIIYNFKEQKWPIPPKYLVINYKTFKILFLNTIVATNLSNEFLFNLKLQKILVNSLKK
jgi:ribosomal protein S4